MKVLIIEDESLAAQKLQKLIEEVQPEFEILACLSSVKESIKWFENNVLPDLIFSDIQLGDGLSFEIFEKQELHCPVIFTTAFNQYAIKAFEVNSIDYLLKPVQKARLEESLEKYRNKKEAMSKTDKVDMSALLNALNDARSNYKSRFLVKLGNKIHPVKSNDIAYFYSDQKLTMLVDKDAREYPLDQSLDDIMQQLDPELFFRVNRKFLIHLDSAIEIKPYFKGRLKIKLSPETEEEIVVSADKTPDFKAWLDH